MYRAYRQAQQDSSQETYAKEENHDDDEDESGDDGEFDESVRSIVERVWFDIEKQCHDKENNLASGNDVSGTKEILDWNTVRVFVSSTFTDFFSEREVLVKKVFPELREWCHDRGLKLLECDLRWGIPKDTSTADTILVCLDEIERCRDINRGQPFFINLVGERYGWIPSADETPDEAREKYGWIETTSITFMEIMHGAYRDKNPNAAFFVRSKTMLDDVPESFHARFIDKEPLARLHLKTMKKKIIKRFPDQVFDYSCKFKQVSNATGREQVGIYFLRKDKGDGTLSSSNSSINRIRFDDGDLDEALTGVCVAVGTEGCSKLTVAVKVCSDTFLTHSPPGCFWVLPRPENGCNFFRQVELADLDEFAEKVLNFLKSVIERTYPHSKVPESETDLLSQEKDLQWLFALDKAKDLIGRGSELEILKEFVEYGKSSNMEQTEKGDSSIRLKEDWELQTSDKAICVLEGSSGWGKTALMCKLIVDTVKSGANVFFHIVNSTPTSNRLECLLRRIILVLIPEAVDDKDQAVNTDNIDELKKLLKTALAKYRDNADTKLVMIIDGLNELDNSDSVAHLSWLPPMFPHNIHCIVSTNPHLPTTARLYEHPTFKIPLHRMTAEELTAVAVRYLQTFTKKLEPSQLESLVSKTGVDNPLWMMIIAEELRIFGDFRVLTDKIDKLPNTMEGLLIHIIDRLILEDDENEVIKKVLCLIACSRHGLPSDSVLKVCGNIKSKEELPPLYWARARRCLKPYLRIFGRLEEIITFSHEAVLKAVQGHLLASQQEVTQWHTILADYYQFCCSDLRVKVYHLPFHLEHGRLKKRLVDFMREDPDSYTHINPWMRSHLTKNVRCRMLADASMPSTVPLMLCHMCSLRHRGFNPACNWQNKKCCVLCGSLCMGTKIAGARACVRHSFNHGLRKCVLCTFMVSSSGTQAQLCMNCGFGHGERTCACFDV